MLGMSTFFIGITETVLSLFSGIFWNEIPFPTLPTDRAVPTLLKQIQRKYFFDREVGFVSIIFFCVIKKRQW
jgi:hypothetical protein